MTLLGEVEWYRGDTYPITLTIKNKTTGNPITLTGYSFKLSVDTREKPDDASTLLFAVDAVVLDQGSYPGQITFTPTAVQTDQTPKTYYYDVQMTDPSSNVRTITKDKWKIVQDITK